MEFPMQSGGPPPPSMEDRPPPLPLFEMCCIHCTCPLLSLLSPGTGRSQTLLYLFIDGRLGSEAPK